MSGIHGPLSALFVLITLTSIIHPDEAFIVVSQSTSTVTVGSTLTAVNTVTSLVTVTTEFFCGAFFPPPNPTNECRRKRSGRQAYWDPPVPLRYWNHGNYVRRPAYYRPPYPAVIDYPQDPAIDRDSNYFRMGDEENEDYDDMLDPSPTFSVMTTAMPSILGRTKLPGRRIISPSLIQASFDRHVSKPSLPAERLTDPFLWRKLTNLVYSLSVLMSYKKYPNTVVSTLSSFYTTTVNSTITSTSFSYTSTSTYFIVGNCSPTNITLCPDP